ncbi:MAG: four helix bundle protein [Candidatus Omnitrophica bacterium]|nr:four helix bundle protein [Candidatus Omnitrophota bacterium]
MIKHFTDLEVYALSYSVAMKIFKLSRKFPNEELYSLTSQLVRSSRSVPANIAEGWSKRQHENIFKKHLLDAIGSVDESKTWIHFAKDCEYLPLVQSKELLGSYDEIGAKLYNLHLHWKTFSP